MVDPHPIRHFAGKRYSLQDAMEIEEYLLEHSGTGEGWGWVDADTGNNVYFTTSGASRKRTIPEEKIPTYGKARDKYFKNKFKY